MTPTVDARIVDAMEAGLRCSACGDAIGTYEPLVVIERGGVRGTSLAREPALAIGAEAIVHRTCVESGRAEPLGLSASDAARIGH
jgi:hypothetical protein